MLPRAAYVDDDVLAWEREHLFDGTWVCAGRADAVAAAGRPARHAGSATTGVLLVRRRRRRAAGVRQHLPPPRPRAAGVRRLHARAVRSQCPYHGWSTSSTARCAWRRVPATCRTSMPAQLGLVPVAVDTWARLGVRQRRRHAPAARRSHRRLRRSRRRTGSASGSSSGPPTTTSCGPTGRSPSRTTTSATTAR